MPKVTDPALLAQLEGGGKVTDAELLKQLDAEPPKVSRIQAILGGVGQGGMMGFGDEAVAGFKSLFPKSMGGKSYKEHLGEERDWHKAAEEQHPVIYTGSEMAGAVAPAVAGGVVSAGAKLPAVLRMLGAAGQGAVQGAGYSNAGDAKSLARDVGLGAGVGTLGFGAGEAVGAGFRGLGRFARARSAAASAKAGEKAAEEVAGNISSAKGALGSEVQKGSRQIENVTRLEPNMTPAQQADLAAQRASGAVPQLEQRVAQSTLEAMPAQAGAIAAKDAEFAAAKQGASQAFNARKTELMQPSFLKDALSLAKSYGEPVAAAYAANKIAGMAGATPEERMVATTAAGMLFGRTRMGKALANRLAKPGNQAAVMGALGTTSEGAGTLLRKALGYAGPALASQELATP